MTPALIPRRQTHNCYTSLLRVQHAAQRTGPNNFGVKKAPHTPAAEQSVADHIHPLLWRGGRGIWGFGGVTTSRIGWRSAVMVEAPFVCVCKCEGVCLVRCRSSLKQESRTKVHREGELLRLERNNARGNCKISGESEWVVAGDDPSGHDAVVGACAGRAFGRQSVLFACSARDLPLLCWTAHRGGLQHGRYVATRAQGPSKP